MNKKVFGSVVAVMACAAVMILAVSPSEAAKRVAPPGYKPTLTNKVGGVDCAGATMVTDDGADPAMYNFNDSDSTCGAPTNVNDYANANCNSFQYPGPELIYQMMAGTDNDFTITLTPTAPADMGVFLISDCATPTSCVAFTDTIGGGAVSQIAPGFQGVAAGQYFIYIDSYYTAGASSCGNYTLQVAGTKPVELMEFSVD